MGDVVVTKTELYKGVDDQWYWRAQGGNGEIIANGEGYKNKADAKAAAIGVTGITPEEP